MERSIKILVSVLIVAIIAFLGYSQIKRWHQSAMQKAVDQEKSDCEKRLAGLREEMLRVVAEVKQLNDIGGSVPQSRLSEIFGEESGRLSF